MFPTLLFVHDLANRLPFDVHPVFSSWCPRFDVLWDQASGFLCRPFGAMLVVLCLITLTALLLYHHSTRRRNIVVNARTLLQDLLIVLTPTHSVWPSTYAALAYRAALGTGGGRSTLRLPLRILYNDIIDGRLELRNPSGHLPALFAGSLTTVSGLAVRLDVDYYSWIKLLSWMLLREFFTGAKQYSIPVSLNLRKTDRARDSLSPGEALDLAQPTRSADTPSSLFLSTLHEETPAVSLDCVPYCHLESYIRRIQAALAPGAFLMLGLTSRPANSSFWSPSTIFTAIPFLPRRSLHKTQRKHIEPRTTTPLFTSVLSVLQLLTTGAHPLTVEVVRNVSREYADFLHETADCLENDPDTRAAFVRQWGMQAWVEDRLCTSWEAALVDAGLLEGWAIVVCKPE